MRTFFAFSVPFFAAVAAVAADLPAAEEGRQTLRALALEVAEATCYSPQIAGGVIVAPVGAFSEPLTITGGPELQLYRKPPEEDGKFRPRNLIATVPIPPSPESILVVFREKKDREAVMFPAPKFRPGGLTLINFWNQPIEYAIGGRGGKIGRFRMAEVDVSPPAGQNIITYSIRPADQRINVAIRDARLRMVPGSHLFLWISPLKSWAGFHGQSMTADAIYVQPPPEEPTSALR